jgi:AcrR family transcriptional regulator
MNVQSVTRYDKILLSIIELAGTHGVHDLAMGKLAKHAGVAAGTLYHHFANKEDMIGKAYVFAKEQFSKYLLKDFYEDQQLEQGFRGIVRNMFDFFLDNPEIFGFIQQCERMPVVPERFRTEAESMYKPAVQLLEQSIQAGLVKDVSIRLGIDIVFGSVASAADSVLNGRNSDRDQIKAELEEFLMQAFKR